MSRCAVVDQGTGVVVNVIIASTEDEPPEGCVLVDVTALREVGLGWLWDGAAFAAPSS